MELTNKQVALLASAIHRSSTIAKPSLVIETAKEYLEFLES